MVHSGSLLLLGHCSSLIVVPLVVPTKLLWVSSAAPHDVKFIEHGPPTIIAWVGVATWGVPTSGATTLVELWVLRWHAPRPPATWCHLAVLLLEHTLTSVVGHVLRLLLLVGLGRLLLRWLISELLLSLLLLLSFHLRWTMLPKLVWLWHILGMLGLLLRELNIDELLNIASRPFLSLIITSNALRIVRVLSLHLSLTLTSSSLATTRVLLHHLRSRRSSRRILLIKLVRVMCLLLLLEHSSVMLWVMMRLLLLLLLHQDILYHV